MDDCEECLVVDWLLLELTFLLSDIEVSRAGATSVLAAVYGPVEVKQSKEKADRTVIEVTVKSATGISGWMHACM